MKLSTKIILALGVVTILVFGWYMRARYQEIAQAVFESYKQDIARSMEQKASTLLSPDDFRDFDTQKQQQTFKKFFEEIQTPDLFRIKVWNTDYVVIWSDLAETIGMRFPDNHEMQEALEGEIELELKADKEEQIGERHYAGFAEVYVPIRDTQGNIVGVIEVYQSIASAREKISGEFYDVLKIAVPSAVLVFVVLVFAVRFIVKV